MSQLIWKMYLSHRKIATALGSGEPVHLCSLTRAFPCWSLDIGHSYRGSFKQSPTSSPTWWLCMSVWRNTNCTTIGSLFLYHGSYKSLTWMWGKDRKFHPEGHCFALRGCAEWCKTEDHEGRNFLSAPNTLVWFYFLHTFRFWMFYFKSSIH